MKTTRPAARRGRQPMLGVGQVERRERRRCRVSRSARRQVPSLGVGADELARPTRRRRWTCRRPTAAAPNSASIGPDGLDAAVAPAVEVPPAGAVGDEVERRRPATTPAGRSTPPARRRPVRAARRCSRRRSARRPTARVPSQGMLGWFQVSQARRRPSGLRRGEE